MGLPLDDQLMALYPPQLEGLSVLRSAELEGRIQKQQSILNVLAQGAVELA